MTINVFQTQRDKEMYALGRKDEREALIAEIREKLKQVDKHNKEYFDIKDNLISVISIEQILKELEGNG